MIIQRLFPIALLFCIAAYAGCSGAEETNQSRTTTSETGYSGIDSVTAAPPKTSEPPDATPPSKEKELPQVEKGVPVSTPVERPRIEQQQNQPEVQQKQAVTGLTMWSVQIGAFKSEEGATQAANEARAKFNQPIYKQFDPTAQFYKVTVGSFATRDEASGYKLEVQAKGYPDAFPVEVKR